MSVRPGSAPVDLRRTRGYLVADRSGRYVGRVEAPMYGTRPAVPDALAVRAGRFARRRLLVPAATISEIDAVGGVVGLRVDRDAIRRFL